MADPGFMAGGFSGDPGILPMGVLTHNLKRGSFARSAPPRGVWGNASPGKFWISDLLKSFLVQSGSNRDRYSLGIYLNWTAETAQP